MKGEINDMNKLACESFIIMCDELMIPAEESIHQIKMTFKEEIRKIDKLKKKAATANGDFNKMIKYYKEAHDILISLYKKINEIEDSSFDKLITNTGNILTLISGIGSAIGVNLLAYYVRKSGNILEDIKPGFIGTVTAGGAGAYAGFKLTKPMRERRNIRYDVLRKIDEELEKIDACIKVLKNPDKYGINDTDFENLWKAEFNKQSVDINKVLNGLLNILNSKITPKMKKLGYSSKFVLDKYERCDGARIFFNMNNEETSKFWDENWESIQEEFEDCVNKYMNVHNRDIVNISIQWDCYACDDTVLEASFWIDTK